MKLKLETEFGENSEVSACPRTTRFLLASNFLEARAGGRREARDDHERVLRGYDEIHIGLLGLLLPLAAPFNIFASLFYRGTFSVISFLFPSLELCTYRYITCVSKEKSERISL